MVFFEFLASSPISAPPSSRWSDAIYHGQGSFRISGCMDPHEKEQKRGRKGKELKKKEQPTCPLGNYYLICLSCSILFIALVSAQCTWINCSNRSLHFLGLAVGIPHICFHFVRGLYNLLKTVHYPSVPMSLLWSGGSTHSCRIWSLLSALSLIHLNTSSLSCC